MFDNGEGLVHAGQAVAGKLVGLGDIRLDVAVWTFCVRENGSDDRLVAVVGKVEGFLAVRVRLEGGDGVGDDRIRGEVLN